MLIAQYHELLPSAWLKGPATSSTAGDQGTGTQRAKANKTLRGGQKAQHGSFPNAASLTHQQQ